MAELLLSRSHIVTKPDRSPSIGKDAASKQHDAGYCKERLYVVHGEAVQAGEDHKDERCPRHEAEMP